MVCLPHSPGSSAILNDPSANCIPRMVWDAEARVELHRRFAFPVACLVFALVAVRSGRNRAAVAGRGCIGGGRADRGVLLMLVMGAGLARKGRCCRRGNLDRQRRSRNAGPCTAAEDGTVSR